MEVTIQIIDMKDNIIELVKEDENYYLVFKKYNFKALAYIGENGLTLHHHEGDKKTQMGTFRLGVAFGIHDYDEIKTNLNYMPKLLYTFVYLHLNQSKKNIHSYLYNRHQLHYL